jgi:plasmid maintenance system killer protein
MRFRFGDPSLERLFASGVHPDLAAEAVQGFFGVLETIAAARDLGDIRALVSLDARETDDGVITMRVDRTLRLNAAIEEGDDGSILRVDAMTDEGPDHE